MPRREMRTMLIMRTRRMFLIYVAIREINARGQDLRDAGGQLEEEGVEGSESEAVDQDRVEGGNAAVDIDRDRVEGEEPSLWIPKGFPHLVGLEVSLIHDTSLVLKSATDSDRALF
jgi:hypothetical protein